MSKDTPQGDELFRLLVEGVKDYAIFMLDPQGRVASWNRGAELIKGYRADEILGRHFSIFYPAEAIARGWPEHELQMAQAEGRFEDEGWRVRKDGSLFWANVVITALYDRDNQLRGFAKVTRDLTERRRVEALEEADSPPQRVPRHALPRAAQPAGADPNAARRDAPVRRERRQPLRLGADGDRPPGLAPDAAGGRPARRHAGSRSGKITLRRGSRWSSRRSWTRAVEASRPLIDARGHNLTVLAARRAAADRGRPDPARAGR